MTPQCPYCKKAKADLNRRRVPFVEKDIENYPSARREWTQLGGKGVPVVLVGKQRMDGYSAPELDAMLTGGGY